MARWSEVEWRLVDGWFAKGMSAPEISRALAEMGYSRSKNAILSKTNQMGLRRCDRVAADQSQVMAVSSSAVGNGRVKKPAGLRRVNLAGDAEAEPVGILDLKAQHCRWPVGEGAGADMMFCGATRAKGSAYCAVHRGARTRKTRATSIGFRATGG